MTADQEKACASPSPSTRFRRANRDLHDNPELAEYVWEHFYRDLVGDTGLEPVTSSVSGKRATRLRQSPEVETGFEPVYTDLQSVASPLGHSTVEALLPTGTGRDSLRADDGIRTRDPHLGKVMLYQLSHVRAASRPAGRSAICNHSRVLTPSTNILPPEDHLWLRLPWPGDSDVPARGPHPRRVVQRTCLRSPCGDRPGDRSRPGGG